MKYLKWMRKNTQSLSGKTVAISGATGGIGQELCKYLAQLGAELILLDRNKEKSNRLRESLVKGFPALSVRQIQLDLEDIDSVKVAAEELKKLKIDVLLLNAGAYYIPRKKCKNGLDNVFQINFLSPYFIVRELFERLQENGGRVVAVSSIALGYSHTDKDDVDFSCRRQSSLVYGNSKRFLTFALHELFKGRQGLSVVHPGITLTNITAHYPKAVFAIIKHPMKVIFMKPEKAALSILKGVFTDCGKNEWIGPRFFNVWGLPKKKKLTTRCESENAFIFKTAEKLYNKMKEI